MRPSAFIESRDQQLLSKHTAKANAVNEPDKLCSEIVPRDQMNQVAFHYHVQDSPGEPAAFHALQDLGQASPGRLCE